ncbi:hypothetical protein [Pseudomonas sp. NFX15]|uniref:hypothetical protein n=1 Tax=Pseudomonas sp. NFX15 TaxID=2816958 RepID=UPI003B8D8E85
MNQPKYPSEQQGGYDPIPTHPEPLSPEHTTTNPEEEPGIDGLPEDEGIEVDPTGASLQGLA